MAHSRAPKREIEKHEIEMERKQAIESAGEEGPTENANTRSADSSICHPERRGSFVKAKLSQSRGTSRFPKNTALS